MKYCNKMFCNEKIIYRKEAVAGFKDIRTGKIEEIMLIRSPEDLEKFKKIYEITEKIAKEY